MVETNPALGRKAGRDHHPQAFTTLMAGGGTKPGTYGEADDFGFHITKDGYGARHLSYLDLVFLAV